MLNNVLLSTQTSSASQAENTLLCCNDMIITSPNHTLLDLRHHSYYPFHNLSILCLAASPVPFSLQKQRMWLKMMFRLSVRSNKQDIPERMHVQNQSQTYSNRLFQFRHGFVDPRASSSTPPRWHHAFMREDFCWNFKASDSRIISSPLQFLSLQRPVGVECDRCVFNLVDLPLRGATSRMHLQDCAVQSSEDTHAHTHSYSPTE